MSIPAHSEVSRVRTVAVAIALVFVFVSQPFAALPSQLPQPALHERMAQVPVEQVAIALARAHATPHAPQLISVLI